MIVTGELRSVANTPFDFRVPKTLETALCLFPRKPVGNIDKCYGCRASDLAHIAWVKSTTFYPLHTKNPVTF
jgi:hypothetical protein